MASPQRQREQCKYFLIGVCRFGSNCLNMHDGIYQQSNFCQYNLKGLCVYGTECRYIHGKICNLCHTPCLHPFNEELRQKHRQDCLKKKEAFVQQLLESILS